MAQKVGSTAQTAVAERLTSVSTPESRGLTGPRSRTHAPSRCRSPTTRLLVEVVAVADRAEQGVLDILVIDERAGRERDQDVGLVEPTVVAGLPLELAPQGPEIVDEAGASKRVAITRWCGKWWPSS